MRGITAMGKKGKRKDDKNEEAEPSGERSSSRKQDPFYVNGLWVECHYNADAGEHKFKCSIMTHDADTGMYEVKAKDDNEVWTVHWDPNHGPGHGIWVKETPVTPEDPNKVGKSRKKGGAKRSTGPVKVPKKDATTAKAGKKGATNSHDTWMGLTPLVGNDPKLSAKEQQALDTAVDAGLENQFEVIEMTGQEW